MFNKALYKQSWKANWVMWLSTTVVSIFVLVIIMFLIGGEGMGKLTESFIEKTTIETLTSEFENSSLTYYSVTLEALEEFDELFIEGFVKELKEDPFNPPTEETFMSASMYAFMKLNLTLDEKIKSYLPPKDSFLDPNEYNLKYEELKNAILVSLSDELLETDYDVLLLVSHLESSDYIEIWQTNYLPENLYLNLNSNLRDNYRKTRAKDSSAMFLAFVMSQEEAINAILDKLKDYKIDLDIYNSFGFDFNGLYDIANLAILTYQVNLEYLLNNNHQNLDEQEIKESLKAKITANFLTDLPEAFSQMMEDFEDQDMYSYSLSSTYYKIVGMLIVIVFVIMVSVNLISGQVETGSMAYILSTGTKRKEVTNTQTLFLVSSIFFSFIATTVTSIIVYTIATPVNSEMTYLKLIIFGVGSFLVSFAFAGINFLTSAIFNRSRQAMAIGGGITILMLIFTILGMFGLETMPALMRVNALDAFNKFSLITLLDEKLILANDWAIMWKFGILIIVGLVTFIIAGEIFKRKDLPL